MTKLVYGWASERDVTHQCSDCFWVLREHRLACCEFAKEGFPSATSCEKYSKENKDDHK